MPVLLLSDNIIEYLEPRDDEIQTDYWDERNGPYSFGIRVSRSGRKTWCAYYRFDRAKRRLSIGQYPTLSLEDARKLADKAFRQIQLKGRDPALLKQANHDSWKS